MIYNGCSRFIGVSIIAFLYKMPSGVEISYIVVSLLLFLSILLLGVDWREIK